MAAIILSLLAAALLSTVLLIPAGHLKQALGIPSAVCSAAAMGLYLQMRTVSGGPGTGIALVQLYLPCAAGRWAARPWVRQDGAAEKSEAEHLILI